MLRVSQNTSIQIKLFILPMKKIVEKFAEFKSHSGNQAKTNFKKVAALRIVSWEFLAIFEDSYTSNWLLTSPCAKEHYNIKDVQNYLISPICLAGSCAACFYFLETLRLKKSFDKIDARGFVAGFLENFLLSNKKRPSLLKMPLR